MTDGNILRDVNLLRIELVPEDDAMDGCVFAHLNRDGDKT